MKIGLFDSGVGGLTILHRALQFLPDEEYFYYADTEHVPYGRKTKEEIVAYSKEATGFLVKKGCDAVVIACNTATSAAAHELRKCFQIPIIGIEPAVKPAVAKSNHKRVLVIATPLTVKEKKLRELVDRVDEHHLVDMMALPELVRFAEQGIFDSIEVQKYLKDSFASLACENYSVIVFGCTHFNHFAALLEEIFGAECKLIDGSEGTVRNLERILKAQELPSGSKGCIHYYQSGREVTDSKTIQFYQEMLEHLEQIEKSDK
ncbi:MAG TPA: glutamate racemase [Lachnospiraceae bacterium]|nr:glutamate racemase [Lachnospiraceae bacterium]HPF29433.1 glutamate racemase [Lachnospiraceae bacterium]